MPERQKRKSPSPKSEELQKRLGYSENPATRKEFSTPSTADQQQAEYNDGTSRPVFKKRIKSTQAKRGETAQLECKVSGSPLPKILWLKNGRPLKASDGCKVIVEEDGTNILVFPNASEDDVGIYTARAMNVNGSIMCSAEFTLVDGDNSAAIPVVESPMDMDFTTPTYFFQMSSCEVSEGRLARFDCRVVAYPRPEIVWMRDGKVIEAADRFRLLNFNNEVYSLLIQDVTSNDTGRYTCWARNKFGEAMTEAYLNVIVLSGDKDEGDIAPKFLTRFYDQQTTEGTGTEFKCLVSGKPEPDIQWTMDDKELREQTGVKMRNKDGVVSLELKKPQVNQSGLYTCTLSNPLGEAICTARLTVVEDKLHGKMLPKFLRKFDHISAREGEDAKFTSVIVGEPKPEITWMFDHKPISDTNRRFVTKKEGDSFTLIIKGLRFDDTGRITCKAVNEEGEVYCSANLHIREAKFGDDETDSDAKFGYVPTFTKRLHDTLVKEGSRATMECKVMGIPEPEISWMKDGRVVNPGGRYHMTSQNGVCELIIDNVTPQDAGVYTCIISNSQGKSSSTAALKIEEPKPEAPPPKKREEDSTLSLRDIYSPDKSLLEDRSLRRDRKKRTELSRADKTRTETPTSYEPERTEAYGRRIFDTPITPTVKRDVYAMRRGSYDSQRRAYESPVRTYVTPRSFESPSRYDRPRSLYDSPKTYESPKTYDSIKHYESPRQTYESPRYGYESPKYYESPNTTSYDSPRFRYDSPGLQLDRPKTYEPSRRYSVDSPVIVPHSLKVPKIPYDRPSLLDKRDDSVRLQWLSAPVYELPEDSRRVMYIVEQREVPNQSWRKLATGIPATSYIAHNLRPDREYEFRVRAQNQHGVSEPTWNASLKRRIDESKKALDLPEMRAPPSLPTHKPVITDLGEDSLRLAWRPAETYQAKRTPPVSYRLEAKELPGKDWMPLSSSLRDTTHHLTQLPKDRDYMIRVRAENDFGISEPTESLWLPRARAFPGVPIGRPEIVDYEDTRAKLSWDRVDIPTFGAADSPLRYMLEVEEPHRDWRTVARDLDDTEYIVEGLKPGRDYRFRVRAKNPTGTVSEPSPAASLYTVFAKSRAPVDRLEVVRTEPDSGSVQLAWQRVSIPPYNMDEEPLMYMIEYNEPPMPDWKPLVTGLPTTRYRVTHLDTSRDYNFRVRALTPYGVSLPSPTVPVSLRPSPVFRPLPEAVTISEVESDSLRLSWRRPMYDLSKPITYQIEMLEAPSSVWRTIDSGVVDTTYRVKGLKPNKDYQFRVIPHIGSSFLEPTPPADLTTLPVKPRLPLTEPKINELTPESVRLSWKPAEFPAYQRTRTPVSYKVEMCDIPGSHWIPVARRVPDTQYTVTGLRGDRDYKFRITAETDLGASEPSMPATLHRTPVPQFSFNEPTIRDMTQNAVLLGWVPAEIPTGGANVTYMVEVQSPPGIASWQTLHTRHPMPSVRLTDLRPDLDYLVRVRSQCGSYVSEPTLPVYIPRRAAPPRLPIEEPYAVDIGSDYIKLQWRSADLPSYIMDYAPVTYKIEAMDQNTGNWATIAHGIPHTDFKVTGLDANKNYMFRVRAENDYGVSDATRPLNVKKRSVAPIMPAEQPLLFDIGPGSARLSWRPATLPSYVPTTAPITYSIFVQELPYKTWRPLVRGIPHTSYHITGLNPDHEYLFRVQAENKYGASKPSEPVMLHKYADIKDEDKKSKKPTDIMRPITIPEFSDFDEDLTSVKLRWKPTPMPQYDLPKAGRYTVETWEPVRRTWKPVVQGLPEPSYQLTGLSKQRDELYRVRMDTDEPTLSQPSYPISLSTIFRSGVYKPQLYEVSNDSVRLSWQPVTLPPGVSRSAVRYIIEQREIPETRWFPIALDVTDTNYKVRGLRSKADYEFRVKTIISGTPMEPSLPVALFRKAVIPAVKLDKPEIYDVDDSSLSLRWNTVDVPAFTPSDEPLVFVIERQILPNYEWEPVATDVTDRSYTISGLEPYRDYNFRVRGLYPSGYTEPSPHVPVYRRPIRHYVPVAQPQVWEEEPTSARLRWHRAYIPRYYSNKPISYRVEMQEAGGTETDWRPVASDVTTPDVKVDQINPNKDYNFRIRAQMENGDVGDPTPPLQYYRTKLAMTRYALQEYKPVEYEAIFLNRPYFDVLYKYVPPRMPIEKPDMFVLSPDTVELGWHSAKVPDSIRDTCNLSYTIEVRCPPSFEWRELVTGLKVCHHTVPKLHPRIDYVFRVRAVNEYGVSEPSLPVSLYRPRQPEEMDDDELEREWQALYGHEAPSNGFYLETKVPPKLPMDTPKVITQSPETIWLSWIPARIPAYATQTRIQYVIEMKEPPSTQWKRDVTGLFDTQYVREGLNPNQEYHFRIKAETEFGSSDPTLPLIIRGKGSGSRPSSRSSSVDRDKDDLMMDMSYLDNLTSGVPPRMASTRPYSSHVEADRLTLSWSACRVPAYVKTAGATYLIEKREPPGHIWSILVKEITTTKYEITGLNKDQDYMFRVRAKNEFGTSEPTLPLTLYRNKDDYVPTRRRSRSGSRDSISVVLGRVGRRSSSIDYGSVRSGSREGSIDRGASIERQPCQPEFLTMGSTEEEEIQYGVIGRKAKISVQARGYPLPTIHWYLGEEKLQYGDRYNTFVTPNGTIVLEIKNVGPDSFGQYKCYAENASGAAVKMVSFGVAEPPTVLQNLKDEVAVKHQNLTLTCKIDGFPSPTIKWMKDWRPLSDCGRMKMVNTKPEVYSLEITNVIESDAGLYACVVENNAGKVTVACRVVVDVDNANYNEIKLNSTPIEERYHVLEEIGRGRYGVVRRVVEIMTGRVFAANFMSMRNKAQKNFFMSEFEVLKSLTRTDGALRIYDAFETDRSFIFVTELLTEPDLLDKITSDGNWTEMKVAILIKKLLLILRELELLQILHLDIKPSNIRMTGSNNDEPKLIGFGLSRMLNMDEDIMHNYGSVGYASPEQITNDVLTNTTDAWSVGVLAYLLLSGQCPFPGSSDQEILTSMIDATWEFTEDFKKFSKEGQDFITKLLVKDPNNRLTIEDCLKHPWFEVKSETKLNTDKLKQFNSAGKIKRETERVFTTVQLQSFSKIIHGIKALYQPAVDIESGEIIFPDCDDYGNYLDEDAWYVWQLQYLDDPDSQMFNVQDKEFTVRESIHAGAPKKPKQDVVRTDRDDVDTGTGVLFLDKIQSSSFRVGDDVNLTCTIAWNQKGDIPIVTWYRDEMLLSDAYRIEENFNEETGVATLTVVSARDYDAATYKCVARTKDGRVSCQARLLLGDTPGKPGCPVITSVSGTEAFLTWTPPTTDGNSYILGYRIDYRKERETKWTHGPYVMEEYALVSGLSPKSSYIFRVSSHNQYGTSPFSWSSLETETLADDAPKITLAAELQPFLKFTSFDSQQLILPVQSRRPSLSVEGEATLKEADPNETFKIADVISKGKYGETRTCADKTTGKQCVAKVVVYSKENHEAVTHEFEILHTLRQANIVKVTNAFIHGEKLYTMFENLSGINIVEFLCLQKTYREEVVAQMIRQVLDALQYLQYYGIVHLNLQPSSIIMATRRRPFVKLRDFTHAQKMADYKPANITAIGYPDFIAPEVVKGESVTHTTDLWTVGALTFTLLSGVSPYGGRNLEETLSRILFDRYDTRDMYDNVTKESVKFVTFLMRRLPRNRPTVQKCLNSQLLPWLQLTESMMAARNSRVFKTDRLRVFLAQYMAQRGDERYKVALVDIDTLPKPDEEEISNQVKYMDDALMFC